MTTPTATRISRDDIEAKFREIQGEVEAKEQEARNYAGIAIAVTVVAVVAVAFVLGRRKGRRGRTIVEVRRL
jgi:lipopolysaccharide export LptBFGC system permease protein LptF